ncbi:MAG TPA: Hsp20/alpha crystallin family protein [Acidobacteriota bacterium]|nr:Hsp20/alpha crystallin family protein [Acidobacteriota bacterium]
MAFDSDLLRQLLYLQERINRVLETPVYSPPEIERSGNRWEPRADVIKSCDSFAVTIELPGIPKDSIVLEAEGGRLVLSGERPARRLPEGGRFLRMEGVYGRFHREFPLPPGADADRIEASLNSGVLEVRIPLA